MFPQTTIIQNHTSSQLYSLKIDVATMTRSQFLLYVLNNIYKHITSDETITELVGVCSDPEQLIEQCNVVCTTHEWRGDLIHISFSVHCPLVRRVVQVRSIKTNSA